MWHHIPTKQNPGNLTSRGIDPVKLQQCEMWWSFLLHPATTESPGSILSETNKLLCELKPPVESEICTLINIVEPLDVIKIFILHKNGKSGSLVSEIFPQWLISVIFCT
ncbi:integrase_H2C2 domain-containing protein [Nephila pilipes]|uniref:Integrase_H2C2 domain-containing protein n=1 Tax=Nephila pilipes TaxID=299642 RepID=A0A8X6QJK6_NEPPI|nr:integrase_H2C2 domain-containing protein [Nephila pilipes]